jgi:hypothetical protein
VLAAACADAVGPIHRCGYGWIDVQAFLRLYHATDDLVTSADDVAMADAYVVGMVVPEEPKEEDGNIEALLSGGDDVDVPAAIDE